MANLVAIAYPDEATAKEVLATLARLQTERSIELEDAVVVTRDEDCKVKLHQTTKTAAAGALTDVGVDDRFLQELGAKLHPGSAALIVLVHRSTPDKVLPEIARFGGEVIQSSLSDEAEAQLQAALEAGAGAPV